MNEDEINRLKFEKFKDNWQNYPSQDNEGYQPERGSYKCGFMDGFEYGREIERKIREKWKFMIKDDGVVE